MEKIKELIVFITANWVAITAIIAAAATTVVTIASVVVKFTPTLSPARTTLLKIIKILSKLSLNRNVNDAAVRLDMIPDKEPVGLLTVPDASPIDPEIQKIAEIVGVQPEQVHKLDIAPPVRPATHIVNGVEVPVDEVK